VWLVKLTDENELQANSGQLKYEVHQQPSRSQPTPETLTSSHGSMVLTKILPRRTNGAAVSGTGTVAFAAD
jgi:hypothetical protein